jgi:hypothetical protein
MDSVGQAKKLALTQSIMRQKGGGFLAASVLCQYFASIFLVLRRRDWTSVAAVFRITAVLRFLIHRVREFFAECLKIDSSIESCNWGGREKGIDR